MAAELVSELERIHARKKVVNKELTALPAESDTNLGGRHRTLRRSARPLSLRA